MRQWLTQSALLSMFGGLGGVILANWAAPLLHVAGIPEAVDLGMNARVLGFTFAVAAGSGILFGLAPILQTLQTNTISALRDEGGAVATGRFASRLRQAFVVFQVAVSLMLLVGAGLFLRTLRNAHAVDLGYGLDSTLVADINLDVRGYSQPAGQVAYQQILERLRGTPGVAAAGASRVTVLSGGARPSRSASMDDRWHLTAAMDSTSASTSSATAISTRSAFRSCEVVISQPPTVRAPPPSPSSAVRSRRGCGPMTIQSASH